MNKIEKKEKKGWHKYRPLIISSAILVLAVIVVLVAVLVKPHSETYKMVQKAIKNTEALDEYTIQIASSSLYCADGITQQIDTDGYIYVQKEIDFVYIYANTASTTSDDSVKDFDVTVSMHSDGEHVYDNLTGKDEIIEDITCEEFDEIVAGYELYRYDEKDVTQVAFEENSLEEYAGSGDMTVTLSRPNQKAMEALAEGMSTATGEEVTADDLTVVAASVTYSIYNEMVMSQTCNFTVSYERSDGKIVECSTATHILYTEETDDEDIDIYIPVEEES